MSIRKIQSKQAMPLNRYVNQLSFDIVDEGTPVDMSKSYLELEVTVPTLEDKHNLVLGRDGLYYPSTCFLRDAKLRENTTGKTLYDLLYCNVLSANMQYWSKGSNNILADSVYSGMGKAYEGTNNVMSVFNNEYPDQNPTLKVPLSDIYMGSLGASDNFVQSDTLEARFLLEPSQKLLMKAVQSDNYKFLNPELLEKVVFNNLPAGDNTFTPPETGIVETYQVDQIVYITGNLGTAEGPVTSAFGVIDTITPDEPGVPGNLVITIDNYPDGFDDDLVNVNLQIVSSSQGDNSFVCKDLLVTNNNLELSQPVTAGNFNDVNVGTVILIQYMEWDPATATMGSKVIQNKIVDVTINEDGALVSVVLQSDITLSNGYEAVFINFIPIYTNIDDEWSIVNAHMVIYRDNEKAPKPPSKLLLNTFSSVNVAMVGGLNKFVYTVKSPVNTFNAYVLSPSSTNLYSFRETLRKYLFSVDNVPLTTIYIDSAGSAVHIDNLNRVYSNSIEYQPKNLKLYRDEEILAIADPTLFPGKLYHSMLKGEPNLHDFNMPDKDLKIDIETEEGETTTSKTIYIFMEQWQQV